MLARPFAILNLFFSCVRASATPPYRMRAVFDQLVFVAWESTLVVLFSVGFAAIVTIIESSFHMRMVVQNDSLVPGFAALLILRELAVVVMALLLTSRVGAGIAAEVATMRVSEQIDALKMLGIDPVRYLVVPRFLACLIGGGVLAILASGFCLLSAMIVSSARLNFTTGGFLVAMRAFVNFQDLILALVKGLCFGAMIPIFSCYYGFNSKPGAEGVGLATTKSVVSSSVAIVIMDFVLSYTFSILF